MSNSVDDPDDSDKGLRSFVVQGGTLPAPDGEDDRSAALWYIKIRSCLQRERSIWKTQAAYPYLSVDALVLNTAYREDRRVVLVTNNFLLQNVTRSDAGRIMAARLVGGGVDAGISQSSDLFPEGAVNPNAYCIVAFEPVLFVGGMPFLAAAPWLVIIDQGVPFQYTIAELRSDGQHSYPHSAELDFTPYKDIVARYRETYLQNAGDLNAQGLSELDALLDELFAINNNIHREASLYHLRRKQLPARYVHHAPTLTAYGRLVHGAGNEPQIEHNLALLHYRKSLEEFHHAKLADSGGDVDRAVLHGAYCMIALATFIEAVANRVHFTARGEYPDLKDSRTAEDKLLEEAERITKNRADRKARSFTRLKQTSAEYGALVQVRKIRNHLVHAIEKAFPVDPGTRLSELFAMITVGNCRRLLSLVRQGLLAVLDQVPEVGVLVRLDRGVIWLGDMEVP